MSENKNNSKGIGVLSLLGVVFVTLKLTGFIDWSWWWVTVPFWGGAAIIIAILLVIVFFSAIVSGVKVDNKPKESKSFNDKLREKAIEKGYKI